MKKLILSVDDLRVESFHALPAVRRNGGTVNAHAATLYGLTCDSCPYNTDWVAYTCNGGQSCQGMCFSDNCFETRDC